MLRWLVLLIIVALLLALVSARAPWLLRWFGRLPGDRLLKRDDGKPIFPLTSFIFLSLVMSVLAAIFDRW